MSTVDHENSGDGIWINPAFVGSSNVIDIDEGGTSSSEENEVMSTESEIDDETASNEDDGSVGAPTGGGRFAILQLDDESETE